MLVLCSGLLMQTRKYMSNNYLDKHQTLPCRVTQYSIFKRPHAVHWARSIFGHPLQIKTLNSSAPGPRNGQNNNLEEWTAALLLNQYINSRCLVSVLIILSPSMHAPLPRTFQVGKTLINGSLVSVSQIKSHLALLDAFAKLKSEIENLESLTDRFGELLEDPDKRWGWFVGLAVDRCELHLQIIQWYQLLFSHLLTLGSKFGAKHYDPPMPGKP